MAPLSERTIRFSPQRHTRREFFRLPMIGAVALFPVILLGLAPGCGESRPPARAPTQSSGAARSSGGPSPFAGLVPCSKDDTTGAGCAKPGARSREKDGADTVWNVPVDRDDPMSGPADALLTVVVFSDFECPYCKRASGDLAQLQKEYGRELRLVWKDCPSTAHAMAKPAAEFARAVRAAQGDPAFWRAHDLLYASQGELGDALFQKIATELGVGWPAIRAAIRDARYGAAIQKGLAQADKVDVTATPTTYINGKRVVGAQPYATYKALADTELARAQRLLSSGTSRAELYERIVASGKQIAPPTDLPAP